MKCAETVDCLNKNNFFNKALLSDIDNLKCMYNASIIHMNNFLNVINESVFGKKNKQLVKERAKEQTKIQNNQNNQLTLKISS